MIESGAILLTVLLAFLEIRHFINDGDIYRRRLEPDRGRAAGLRRARHDHRARTAAPAHRQHRARRRRADHRGARRSRPSCSGSADRESDAHRRAGRRAVRQSDPARLRPAGGADRDRSRWCRAASAAALQRRRGGDRGRARARLSHARSAHALSRRGAQRGPTSDAEQYTYSAVWLAFGVALLVVGMLPALAGRPARLGRGRHPHRLQGLPDRHERSDRHLSGLSFIGLGIVLLGIGWLYQRLLFPRRAPPAPSPA